MEVLVIQPPAVAPVILDQTRGHVGYVAPPWEVSCLLSYLRQRTRHTGRIFDARIRSRWEDDLAINVTTKKPATIAAVHCGIHDLDAAKRVVTVLRRARAELPIVGFGELPTLNPSSFRAMSGMEYGIAGDPEPTLRQLLDNFHIAFRRQRIAGLIQDSNDIAAPLWVGDLKTLAMPDWADVSLPHYDTPAYPSGSRADICMSRGAGELPVGALERPDGAPLRFGPMDRCVDMLQECTHLGVSETHFADPPDIWNADRLDEWLSRLARIQNAQDWSLRLLALPLGESFRSRLVDQRCRRIELLVPSGDPDIAARLDYETPDPQAMLEMSQWFQKLGVQLDYVFWIGGEEEPRGEASRILKFVRRLRYVSFALEARPDVPPAEPRLADIARDVRRRVALSPGRRLAGFFKRIRSYHLNIDEEHRDLVIRPRGPPQAITGETDFHSLEKRDTDTPNDWKDGKGRTK